MKHEKYSDSQKMFFDGWHEVTGRGDYIEHAHLHQIPAPPTGSFMGTPPNWNVAYDTNCTKFSSECVLISASTSWYMVHLDRREDL